MKYNCFGKKILNLDDNDYKLDLFNITFFDITYYVLQIQIVLCVFYRTF